MENMFLLCLQVVGALLLIKLISSIVKYLSSQNEFRRQGIPGPAELPFFGTHVFSTFRKGFAEMDRRLFERFGKSIALKEGSTDILLTVDPEIIKEVYIKQFENFSIRKNFNLNDEFMKNSVNLVGGEKWKRLRAVISPTFSAAKLKLMMNSLHYCSNNFLKNILRKQKENGSVEILSCANCYTMDCIAEVAFGLRLNSSLDSDNEFVKNGIKIFETMTSMSLRLIMLIWYPGIANILNRLFGFENTILKRESKTFFARIVRDIIKNRHSKDEKADMIQFLLNSSEEESSTTGQQKISEDEIIAQSVLFFAAGFHTTSITLSVVCYHLALYQSEQDLVRQEIKDACGSDEQPTYEQIQQLKYIDAVIYESTRLFPLGYRLERMATSDTVVKGICVKKGSRVDIPLWMLGRVPETCPDPEKFQPNRFVDGDKSSLISLPFGLGPRNCVAMRLAMLEMKVALVKLLSCHKITLNPSMKVPITVKNTLLLNLNEKILLDFERIEN